MSKILGSFVGFHVDVETIDGSLMLIKQGVMADKSGEHDAGTVSQWERICGRANWIRDTLKSRLEAASAEFKASGEVGDG